MGKIVEIDAKNDLLVLLVDETGKERDFEKAAITSIKPLKSATRASSKGSDDKAPAKDDAKAEDGKRTRSTNGEVSISVRIMELMIDEDDITTEKLDKLLQKEGLKYSESTLKMNYASNKKFIEMAKKAKRWK